MVSRIKIRRFYRVEIAKGSLNSFIELRNLFPVGFSWEYGKLFAMNLIKKVSPRVKIILLYINRIVLNFSKLCIKDFKFVYA